MSACPVDHGCSSKAEVQPPPHEKAAKCPVDHGDPSKEGSGPQDKCPVDHTSAASSSAAVWAHLGASGRAPLSEANLSRDREMSSIPRASEGNWVYPSEAQFFAAMARKNHNPHAADMKTIVPIHNAVNERAWSEILKWEAGRGGEACGGPKLVTFKGRPQERSPKARLKMLLGYGAPFDRHDWVVDRCGIRTRYIIDFYTGRNTDPTKTSLSFYLDVRPALDNWDAVKMRFEHFWRRWF
ncbi:hypothetical protein AX16_008678 [Volvariella volvacea WC 439]|nr:hypothetical protein AX16_008678 [Volvariella volvacea WC 439]